MKRREICLAVQLAVTYQLAFACQFCVYLLVHGQSIASVRWLGAFLWLISEFKPFHKTKAKHQLKLSFIQQQTMQREICLAVMSQLFFSFPARQSTVICQLAFVCYLARFHNQSLYRIEQFICMLYFHETHGVKSMPVQLAVAHKQHFVLTRQFTVTRYSSFVYTFQFASTRYLALTGQVHFSSLAYISCQFAAPFQCRRLLQQYVFATQLGFKISILC